MSEEKPASSKAALFSAAIGLAMMAGLHNERVGRYREPEKKAPPPQETREARHRQKMARKKQRRKHKASGGNHE